MCCFAMLSTARAVTRHVGEVAPIEHDLVHARPGAPLEAAEPWRAEGERVRECAAHRMVDERDVDGDVLVGQPAGARLLVLVNEVLGDLARGLPLEIPGLAVHLRTRPLDLVLGVAVCEHAVVEDLFHAVESFFPSISPPSARARRRYV